MRKSLRDIEQIERYLEGKMATEEHRAFEVRRLCDTQLQDHVERQRSTYDLIREYGRRQMRRELDSVYHRLMRRPSFRERIRRIFSV